MLIVRLIVWVMCCRAVMRSCTLPVWLVQPVRQPLISGQVSSVLDLVVQVLGVILMVLRRSMWICSAGVMARCLIGSAILLLVTLMVTKENCSLK